MVSPRGFLFQLGLVLLRLLLADSASVRSTSASSSSSSSLSSSSRLARPSGYLGGPRPGPRGVASGELFVAPGRRAASAEESPRCALASPSPSVRGEHLRRLGVAGSSAAAAAASFALLVAAAAAASSSLCSPPRPRPSSSSAKRRRVDGPTHALNWGMARANPPYRRAPSRARSSL